MRFLEFNTDINEATVAWAKRGKKVVRKYRCTSGFRKGRVVATPGQCFAAPDIKKRIKLKKVNPASKRVAALNRSSR